jgi:hypothetical protein
MCEDREITVEILDVSPVPNIIQQNLLRSVLLENGQQVRPAECYTLSDCFMRLQIAYQRAVVKQH